MGRDKQNYNEYMRKYMLDRYNQRMNWAIDKLGGKCVICSTKEELQLDHIDPSTKSFTIGKLWSINEVAFKAEVNKCQLLCAVCHESKTLKDLRQISAKTSHGTLSSYRYCKCNLCREANNKYSKEWKQKNKLNKNSAS